MRIPNPFVLVLRVIAWPFLRGFMLLLHSVRFQKWWLRSFAKMGLAENVLTTMAEQLNTFNRAHGIEATYVIGEPNPVERTNADEEKASGEAKT
jgi:hypothetical protein